jgi:hypothetical protein
MKFVVRYKSKIGGPPVYQGGPGIDVNAGVRVKNTSVVLLKNALRFDNRKTAERHAKRCNKMWVGEVIEVDD